MVQEILIGLFIVGLQFISAIILSAGALYGAISLLDRLTPNINEWKLIKKGNAAVGLFYATVMLATIILVAPRIIDFISVLNQISYGQSLLMSAIFIVAMLINYFLGLLITLIVLFLTLHIIDRLTTDVNEFEELEKGNVAMSLITSTAMLTVSALCFVPMSVLFRLIADVESRMILSFLL